MRLLATVLAAILIAVLAWFAGRSYSRPAAQATATPTSLAPSTPTPAAPPPTPSPLRHRLAGTVVGDVRYAVIEDATGGNDLYRPGQTVPDLGLLVEVGPRAAVFENDGRRFELELTSAATPTPEPTPVATEEEDEDDLTESTPDSVPTRASDSSDSESSSSNESDRPAS